MAQVQLHRHQAPLKLGQSEADALKLNGAATQLSLDGIISQLESNRWIRNHNVEQMQLLGSFAVEEKNRKAKWHLKFECVYMGWYQQVAGGRGHIHLLHLVAKHDGVFTNYQAYVWEKCDCQLELRSLSPLVLEAAENPVIRQ